ncbi:Fez family zinc finger protein 1 [Frankliniella fusca]|uniref:Fez family zinc finger protein 1 n=1 Tax=Frankliniella fusca TaxID=407009 RepID=A0AAE1H228_9NEOP|nr:Fez family zinc finger protein 1 [Frankliniella fusca]
MKMSETGLTNGSEHSIRFVCDVCSAGLSRPATNLKRHHKFLLNEEQEHSCWYCERDFNRSNNVMIHTAFSTKCI